MKKLVYLHELDSVRTSELGIKRGLDCLFEEVVKNGNYVAITMNQLADSKIIFAAIQDREDFNHILSLFEKGVIRISRYVVGEEEIRTPAQYMLKSLNKNIKRAKEQSDSTVEEKDSFITSALPIKHNDSELMEVLRDAIMHSDPEYVRVACERLSFAESAEKQKELIDYFCTYVEFILSVSKMQLAGNPPKINKAFVFEDFMKELTGFEVDKWFGNGAFDSDDAEIAGIYQKILTAVDGAQGKTILMFAGEYAAKTVINNRSNWHNYFSQQEDEKRCARDDFEGILSEQELLFAEMLIDLCYNYTVEESILNVSHHYTDFNDKESLHADIKERIIQYWREMKEGIYSPRTEEPTEYIPFPRDGKSPDWGTSSRIIVKEADAVCGKVYEEDFQKEQKEWNGKVKCTIFRNIAIAVFYAITFFATDMVMGYIQEGLAVLLNEQVVMNVWVSFVIDILLFTVIFALINSTLAKLIHLPDILESIDAIWLSIRDSRVIRKIKKLAYRRDKG